MTTRPKAQTMSIDELFRDGRAIDAAAKRAVRRAVAELDRDTALSPAATKKKSKAKPRRAPKPSAAAARAKRAKPVTPATAASSKSRSATKRRAA